MARFRPSFFKLAIALSTLTLVTLMADDPVRRTVGGTTRQLRAAPDASPQAPSAKLPREAQLDANQVNFIRPGITVKIVSASIAQDGTITARVVVADPKGLPLDKDGINTPGPIALRFIAARIPQYQKQFIAYTTTTLKATINTNASQIQAGTDSGGTITKNGEGDYTYTFKTKAPAGFDASATHAIGVTAVRDLSEFMTYDEWTEVANDVFNFVPNGSPVTVTRSVVTTDACNQCHNPLIGHGGSRLKVEVCILCHTPQTVNPDTLLTQDMPVLIHKIHMGSSLPSVKAGTPYRIWHRGNWSDFSDVVFPQDIRNCTTCHTAAATQNDAWKTNPTQAYCGSCHDDVNWATGLNHVDYPVYNDAECKFCHDAGMGWELDASIPGAHVVPSNAASLPGIVMQVLKVENTVPGANPTVTFSVLNKAGNPVDISKLSRMRVLLYGPNTDYKTGPGAIGVTEDASKTVGNNGVYRYTMTNKLPAAAAGSYTISLEARNSVTMYSGTLAQTSATDSAKPVEFYFTVDNSQLLARRVVVTTEKCAVCHQNLNFIHGGTRGAVQECVLCHNPTLVDDDSKQSVNFAWQIHSIHRGEALANPYTLEGKNFQEVLFPGDLRVCTTCHVNNSYKPENIGATALVSSPGGFTPTTPPISAACQGCHDDEATASHTMTNTSTLGESCVVCHGGDAAYSMDKAHAR